MSVNVIYGPWIPPGEMALCIAAGELGVTEEPHGSNRGPRVDVYLRAAGLDPARGSYPWCAAFVTWAVREAQLRMSLMRFRGSASVTNLLARNASLVTGIPARGDVFIHLDGKGKGHTGFVSRVHSNGAFTTVEGNTDLAGSRTGGQVMTHRRPPGYAVSFLRVA